MENIQKNFVTAQDVADYVGCCKASVNFAFVSSDKKCSKLVSAQLKAKILDAAKELGYDPHVARSAGGKYGSYKAHSANKPSMKDIAQACDCSIPTVSRVVNAPNGPNSDIAKKILQVADEIGYVLPARKAVLLKEEKEKLFRLKHNNCSSIDEENQYMEGLRSMGFSNAQICRKVGLTIQTVRRRIGNQPNDLTKENRIAGQKHRAAENHRRKVYVDTHLVTEYNALITQCVELRTQAAELITKSDELTKTIKEMQPKVEKASLATVKPAQLPPEQLSMLNMAPSTPIQ